MKNVLLENKNRYAVALLLLLLAFAAIKVQTLDIDYINRDEPLYSWQSLAVYHNPEIAFSEEINQPYPAIIPLLSVPFNAFFEPPIPVRIIVFLLGFVCLFFTYLLGKKIFSKKAGLAAMIFLMASPVFFFFSTKAMPEVPLIALASMAFYFLVDLNKKKAIALPIIIIIMYAIKPAALVLLPPMAIYLAVKYRKKLEKKWVAVLLATIGAIVIIAFFTSPHNAPAEFEKEFSPGWDYFQLGLLILEGVVWQVAGIPLIVFALVTALALRQKVTPNTGLLILWILLAAVPFFVLKIWTYRYYMLILPPMAILAGKGLEILLQKRRALVLCGVLIVIAVLTYSALERTSVYYTKDYTWGHWENKKLGRMENWLSENVKKDEKVILLSYEFFSRGAMIASEKALGKPREQLVINPPKNVFEEMLTDKDATYYLIIDNMSRRRDCWLYTMEENWQTEYLPEKGFKKIIEFGREDVRLELPETYYIYKRGKT